jgi:hypothetical protein
VQFAVVLLRRGNAFSPEEKHAMRTPENRMLSGTLGRVEYRKCQDEMTLKKML